MSTSVEIIFKAISLKSKENILNYIQYNGCLIQKFLNYWEIYKIHFIFTADIPKMYKAISINPDERYQNVF